MNTISQKTFLLPSEAAPLEPWVFYPRMFFEDLEQHFPRTDNGKWMLFYPRDRLDEKWTAVIEAYNNGLLGSVWGMKCSTLSPVFVDGRNGVVILYCENSFDRDKILETGRQIAFIMDYPSSKLYYKLDSQTRGEAPGKSLYSLKAPSLKLPSSSVVQRKRKYEVKENTESTEMSGIAKKSVTADLTNEKNVMQTNCAEKKPTRPNAVPWIDEDLIFSTNK